MTDEQIIKALECCSMGSYPACRDCPYHDDYVNRDCINKRNADIKDLIIREQKEIEAKQAHILCLKAEIERLTGILNSYALQYGTVKSQSKKIKEIKSEAINAYSYKPASRER